MVVMKKYTVLVADDEPEIRAIVEEELKHASDTGSLDGQVSVLSARDGTEAIEQVYRCANEGSTLDMAVLDLLMPGKSGTEVLPYIRKEFPSAAVVVLSGLDQTLTGGQLIAESNNGGVIRFVQKPVTLEVLAGILCETLRRHDSTYIGSTPG